MKLHVYCLALATLALASCRHAPQPQQRRANPPPLPGGAFGGVPLNRAGGAAFVDPQSLQLRMAVTNGNHIEYELFNTNTLLSFVHCCPVSGIELSFPTQTNHWYFVQVSDSLSPLRVDVDALGKVYGYSRVNIHDPPPANTTVFLTNTWNTLSGAIPGTGSNVTWRGNLLYSNAFFRVLIK